MYIVYALVSPLDKKVYYVGMTKHIVSRFVEHLRCTDNNSAKNAWIQDLQQQGFMPVFVTLEHADCHRDASNKEDYWIDYFTKMKMPLINLDMPAPYFAPQVDGYSFTEVERPILINLYRQHRSIDKVLRMMRKSARYQKDASRILKEERLV